MFVYAVGGSHPYREPCRSIVERASRGELAGEASVELVQEFVHVRLRRHPDRDEALALTRSVAELCDLHDLNTRDLPLVLTLLRQHEQLHVRDAVHAATALAHGIELVLSPDRAFDAVAGLQRVDPADSNAVRALSR